MLRLLGARCRRLAVRLAILLLAVVAGPGCGVAADVHDRIQLHRNPGRSMPYRPPATIGGGGGNGLLAMRVMRTIQLDGNPIENIYGKLLPIDVDGSGRLGFVHFNGFRYMQVWSADGRKLWRVGNPTGRVNSYLAGTHRDSAAILDVDGDGKQDIVHCWVQGGKRVLASRRGSDGKVLRMAPLTAGVGEDCNIAAFRMADTRAIQILVADRIPATAAEGCAHNWTGYWARTVAYDRNLTKLWERQTCDAGHYAWPLDEDRDGWAEAVYVGKFLLRADGSERCRLAGWPVADHVDSLSIADIDPVRTGEEAIAVGQSGAALFEAATCQRIWTLPRGILRNPQHLGLARLDPESPAPLIAIEERGSEQYAKTAIIDARGQMLASASTSFRPSEASFMPMGNAELDGNTATEELVGSFGEVLGANARLRLDRAWYWDLKGNLPETRLGYYPMDYDRWQAFPLVFDYDGDGRDEIVQWGQSLIVIGKADPSLPPPTPRAPFEPLPPGPAASNMLYWLRYVASYPDLIRSIGADPARAHTHFDATGRFERRLVTFDPALYVARNPWVRWETGNDPIRATTHFITKGYARGWTWLDTPLRWLRYIADYGDLIKAYGPLATAGELHWAAYGQTEGRSIRFNATSYLAQTPAAAAACGNRLICATTHYINARKASPPR